MQFDALRAELQAGDYYKLVMGAKRLKVVGFNLEGVATEWYRWMTRNGALSKLLQTWPIEDYQREFKKLMNRVTYIKDLLLISFYISGLKLNLQRELLVSKPTTLSDAFSLARIIKARLDDQAAPVTIQASKIVTSFWNQKQATPRVGIASSVVNVNKPPLLPMPPQMTSNVNTKPLAIKWKFLTVRQERLNKCVRGHKCPGKFLLLMADEDDDTVQESEPDTLDTTESCDISILNSLIGQGSPRSLQLWEIIGIGDVYELVDNGGSHTFVQPKVGELMRRQAMVMGWPYQSVRGSPEEAMWEWMSDSQSAYSLYHLKGKVNFEGAGNVTP
ncbi:hypothetical protein Tco_0455584, partial [Tanacetum coccineum]